MWMCVRVSTMCYILEMWYHMSQKQLPYCWYTPVSYQPTQLLESPSKLRFIRSKSRWLPQQWLWAGPHHPRGWRNLERSAWAEPKKGDMMGFSWDIMSLYMFICIYDMIIIGLNGFSEDFFLDLMGICICHIIIMGWNVCSWALTGFKRSLVGTSSDSGGIIGRHHHWLSWTSGHDYGV